MQSAEFDEHARRAGAAIAAGDWPAADAALAACLALKPGDPALSYNLALVEKRLGRNDAAERRLADVLAVVPDHANARFEYAAALMDRGAEADALRAFDAYLTLEPEDADARLNAARLCLRLDDPNAAAAHLAFASRARPDAPAVRLALAETARDLGRLDEATATLRALYEEVPDLRPTILKIMSQGARGRVPILAARCGGPRFDPASPGTK